MRRLLLVLSFVWLASSSARATETAVLMLSGHGPEDAVPWEFFCTDGRNSREWSTILVPSCWEQQGFGTYNYGNEMQTNAGVIVGQEQGLYRRTFSVPAEWRGQVVRVVFDGVMTDASVRINGESAGPTHQGAFYRFHYDITSLLRFGEENLIEVTVAKNSSNRSINDAERAADYWIFGGIFRPVWLEARPARFIDWTAIDARADGSFRGVVHLGGNETAGTLRAVLTDAAGEAIGPELAATFEAGASEVEVRGRFEGVDLWTAETPALYHVRFSLESGAGAGAIAAHTVTERFGFRTIEVRENDGVYLNGTKIVLKGVNRHCFWPETARTVSREQSYADARLIKAANMNAVRMSHYPPDRHFLEACDELGLYVLDELGGWQTPYDIPTGARLIGELVRRDVNHPSILFWDNGNEGGWRAENDGEFARWDPQGRAVLHPWAVNSGINTDHYEHYESTVKLSAGPQIFMPTEFLHGLWDGGIGAGFRDYWDVMGSSPTVAGGFFWVWSDESVARTDRDGRLDSAGNQAPDGMVGPHRELEGSYFTVKEIWSPVQVGVALNERGELARNWDGMIEVENGYDFTRLAACRLEWRQGSDVSGAAGVADVTGAAGSPGAGLFEHDWQPLRVPDLAPRSHGQTRLDPSWLEATSSVVQVRAVGPDGEDLWTWSWWRERPSAVASESASADDGDVAGDAANATGAAWPGEPRLVAFRYEAKAFVPVTAGVTLDEVRWSDLPEGGRRCDFTYTADAAVDILGVAFDLPGGEVRSKRWLGRGPYRVYRNRMEGGVIDRHELTRPAPPEGDAVSYPEFDGYFRDWRWLELVSDAGAWRVENVSGVPNFGLGSSSEPGRSVGVFPDTGFALLEVIPAIGSKFAGPESTGPRGVTPHIEQTFSSAVVFRAVR